MSENPAAGGVQEVQKEPDLFDFRLKSASLNLDALGAFEGKITARNDLLAKLREKLVDDSSLIKETLELLGLQIEAILLHSQRRIPSALDIKRAAEGANEHLQSLRSLFKDASKQANEISVLQLKAKATVPRKYEFEMKIDQSRDQLLEIGMAANHLRWQNLKGLGSTWVEYLDYLAGLSLRHDGFDNGVCDIADALIDELQSSVKSLAALAIPGREGCGGTTPKIVYLRFPEWTIWALPLAAHELWHIAEAGASIATTFYNRASRDLGGIESKEGSTEEKTISVYRYWNGTAQLKDCLADAFATYTMGPAYAWSSVFLALDPLIPQDQFRAQTILNVLKRLNGNDKPGPFEAVQNELAQRWQQAIREAGQTPQVLSSELEKWTDCFLVHLGDIQNLRFPTERWVANRSEWVPLLRDGAGDIDSSGLSIRFVLTAAWKARIERPAAAAEIANRCYEFCKAMAKASASTARSGADVPPDNFTGYAP